MSKTLSKYTFEGEYKKLKRRLDVISRNHRVLSKQKEVKSTVGKTSLQIDNEISPQLENPSEELNGIIVSDPINNLLLVRQNNVWRKIKTEEL